MNWTAYLTDNFARGSTTAGVAGSTTGVGNGWIDRAGGMFALSNGQLAPFSSGGNGYLTNWLVRPASEGVLNQRAVWTFLSGSGSFVPIVLLRVNSASAAGYAAYADFSGHLTISAFGSAGNSILTTVAFAGASSAKSYIIDFRAVPNATAGTDLSASVFDAAAPTVALATATVAGDTTAGLQVAGTYGVSGTEQFPGASLAVLYAGSVAAAMPSAGPLTCVPAVFPLGVATPFVLTGSGTAWTGSTRPTVSGGSGAFVSNVVASGQTLSGTLNPGQAAAALTLGDSTDASTVVVSAVANVVNNMVWHGDSLTYGQNGSGAGSTGATRIGTVLSALGPTWRGSNQGVAGQTLVQMTAQVGSVVNGLYDPSKISNVLIAQGGHNDIGQGATAATVIARIEAYVAAALAAHPWRIVWCTEPPAAFPGVYPATFDAIRTVVNAWMRLNWQSIGIGVLADFALDARMGLDGCEYNATYYSGSDFTHPTDAGYAIWGSYDLAAVALLSGGLPRRWTH